MSDPIEWKMRQELIKRILYGCMNHGCIFNLNRDGMHTNGVCHCLKDAKEIAQKLKEGKI